MKKLSALVIGFIVVFNISFSSLAASPEVEEKFSEKFVITGGIDTEKEIEATFDKSRTISGTAEVGSFITISVCQVLGEEEYSEAEIYEIVVGSSGYFSQSVDLSIGENLIDITAEKDDVSYTINANIKRKKSEIKSELFKNISFPSVL